MLQGTRALRQGRVEQRTYCSFDARQMAKRRIQNGADKRPVIFLQGPVSRIAVLVVEGTVKRKFAINDSRQNLRRRRARLETRFCRSAVRARNGRRVSAEWLLLAV